MRAVYRCRWVFYCRGTEQPSGRTNISGRRRPGLLPILSTPVPLLPIVVILVDDTHAPDNVTDPPMSLHVPHADVGFAQAAVALR